MLYEYCYLFFNQAKRTFKQYCHFIGVCLLTMRISKYADHYLFLFMSYAKYCIFIYISSLLCAVVKKRIIWSTIEV